MNNLKNIKGRKMKTKINRYDIALIAAIVIINVVILFSGGRKAVHADEKIAYVYSHEELVGEYVMSDDYETEFTVGDEKSGYNTVHIENGEIWIHDATCPDKICLSQGKISRDGEIIVCLPNQFMIQIEDNAEEENDVDFMAQ
jgi:hypothetical protein